MSDIGYNGGMKDCNCNPTHVHSQGCPSSVPKPRQVCAKTPVVPPLTTVVYPPVMGTDKEGEPNAPALKAFKNTIVVYQANKAVYIYDSQGVYTELRPDLANAVVTSLNGLTGAIQLGKLTAQINGETMTVFNGLDDAQFDVHVPLSTEIAEGNEGFVSGNTAYQEQQRVDQLVANTAAALQEKIDEIINSPDVRYIVDTYADLEALDKTKVGDQDYARVLTDETHDNQSTYYQFNKTDNTWDYIGSVGPYYTKDEIDAKEEALQQTIDGQLDGKQDTLVSGTTIKTVNGESLLGEGNLEIQGGAGGGGSILTFNTYADLQAASTTGLEYGSSAVVLQDETHNDALSIYTYVEKAFPDQDGNMLVGASYLFGMTGWGGFDFMGSNASTATLALIPTPSASKVYIDIARQDLLPGFDYTQPYSIQIQAVSGDAPSNINVRYPTTAWAPGTPYPDVFTSVPTDGTNVNLTALDAVPYPVGINGEYFLELDPTTITAPCVLNIRLYPGEDHAQAAMVPGWEYEGSTSSSSVKLYEQFSNAVDGANTAKFLSDKLNAPTIALGANSSLQAGYNSASGAIVIGRGANSSYSDGGYSLLKSVVIGDGAQAIGGFDPNSPAPYGSIAIGYQALCRGINGNDSQNIAIGGGAECWNTDQGLALGTVARCNGQLSVALGTGSQNVNDRDYEVSIGDNLSNGFARYLTGVKAGELDTDAVNMSQLNALIARVEALENK